MAEGLTSFRFRAMTLRGFPFMLITRSRHYDISDLYWNIDGMRDRGISESLKGDMIVTCQCFDLETAERKLLHNILACLGLSFYRDINTQYSGIVIATCIPSKACSCSNRPRMPHVGKRGSLIIWTGASLLQKKCQCIWFCKLRLHPILLHHHAKWTREYSFTSSSCCLFSSRLSYPSS